MNIISYRVRIVYMSKITDKLFHKTKFKQPIDEKSLAMTLGLFFAALHMFKYLLVSLGGQSLLDWIMGLHAVSVQTRALPFDGISLVIGTVLAFASTYIAGLVLASLWNWSVKQKW